MVLLVSLESEPRPLQRSAWCIVGESPALACGQMASVALDRPQSARSTVLSTLLLLSALARVFSALAALGLAAQNEGTDRRFSDN